MLMEWLMEFAESAIASIDISKTTVEIGPPFAETLRRNLDGRAFSSDVQSIVFFPTIIPEEMGRMPDALSYKRGEPSVFIKINISHRLWAESTVLKRIELYAAALIQGIRQIKDSKMSALDREQFVNLVEATSKEMARSKAS
jgi:hypothetical protein